MCIRDRSMNLFIVNGREAATRAEIVSGCSRWIVSKIQYGKERTNRWATRHRIKSIVQRAEAEQGLWENTVRQKNSLRNRNKSRNSKSGQRRFAACEKLGYITCRNAIFVAKRPN